MTGRIRTLEHEVAIAARRFDIALADVGEEQRDLRRIARALSPKLLIGVGLAGGLLMVVLPRHLRGSTLMSLGKFALTRVLPLLAARDEDA